MAITQEYLSMDEYFRFTEGNKIIINHLTYIDSNDMEYIQDKLTTVYDSDTISTIPSCECGVTKGRCMLGMSCPECSTECVDPKAKTKPVLWFEKLSQDMPFISPAYWNSVTRLLSTKMDLLRWLSDPQYTPPSKIPNYILLAKEDVLGGKRGYYELITNFEKLLNYFVNSTELKAKTSYREIVMLRDIYIKYKDDILSTYLPVFNKKLFVIENTSKGKYANLALADVIDAITLWLRVSGDDVTFKKKSEATGTLIAKLAELYVKYYKKFLISKPGSFRKHIYGGRSNFTFRTVITASIGKHRHNGIVPPWVIALTTYRPHMLNLLIKRGVSYMEADRLLNKSITEYHPLIDELQVQLVKGSPHPLGLPVIVNRNPSLTQSSALLTFITEFNNDPGVQATTISPLVAKNMNADYDYNTTANHGWS